ncbi:hypothetical protein TOPH_06126 [Tolypocladium ophioglossoides CBS 100239]|uniref:Uncharacterized protein n=1 Tax=Tolypocladium ophioglossoides (strain CBS 100239) TaxID=1163406 RepID=A0A0L0N4W2_TOLOC|nr:hypothetical protein TOPH_06126 [Tolypocladium ophioglossoides CBS 100239]
MPIRDAIDPMLTMLMLEPGASVELRSGAFWRQRRNSPFEALVAFCGGGRLGQNPCTVDQTAQAGALFRYLVEDLDHVLARANVHAGSAVVCTLSDGGRFIQNIDSCGQLKELLDGGPTDARRSPGDHEGLAR